MQTSYIEESMWSPELAQRLAQSEVYPLAQELTHVFEMKVVGYIPVTYTTFNRKRHYEFNSPHQEEELDGFIVGYEGIPQCIIYCDDKGFNCHMHYEIKDRGYNDWDRHTVASHKLSQVMKTLIRKGFDPSDKYYDDMRPNPNVNLPVFKYGDMVERHGEFQTSVSAKKHTLTNHKNQLTSSYHGGLKAIEALVRKHYGDGKAMSHESELFLKDHVDKYNELLHDYETAKENAISEIGEEFTAIGTSTLFDGIFVVDCKLVIDDEKAFEYNQKVVKVVGSSVYKSIEELPFHDDIVHILTMAKLADADRTDVALDYFRKQSSDWNPDLGLYYTDQTYNRNPFKYMWIKLPYNRKAVLDKES